MSNYRFGLTMRDEGVPDGYISIYKIFTESKYALPGCDPESWCIGEEQLKKMRFDTFHEIKKRVELCNSKNFAKFWNGNLDAINDLGLNRFANLLFFREIATAMICFQTMDTNKITGRTRKMVSWGIKDSIYREYYKSLANASKTGQKPKRVNLFDSRKSRNGNVFKLPDVRLTFETENGTQQFLKIKKNAVYNRFEFWCKANGISKRDGVYKALNLLMQQYPVKGLAEIGAYERKCDLDYTEVLIPEQTTNSTVSSTVAIPKKIHMQMRQIIDRYNRDPENIGKKSMSVSTYITQAVDLLNRKSPLKYSDPEKYKDYVKAKIAEQYNKTVIDL